MGTLRELKPCETLCQVIRLPLSGIRSITQHWLTEATTFQPPFDTQINRVIDALCHYYFIDATASRWHATYGVDGMDIDPSMWLELRNALQGLIRDTIGPLVPSLRYRYEIIDSTLLLTPTLPTLHDHDERLAALACLDDSGWVPTRFRR